MSNPDRRDADNEQPIHPAVAREDLSPWWNVSFYRMCSSVEDLICRITNGRPEEGWDDPLARQQKVPTYTTCYGPIDVTLDMTNVSNRQTC